MQSIMEWLPPAWERVKVELREMRDNQDGYSTEAVIVTSLLVALAIAAVAIIAVKVMSTANGIQTN